MSNIPLVHSKPLSVQPQLRQALGGLRFDLTVTLLGVWWLGGLYVDGWAHTHGRVDDSFFTPWHALFYSGYAAVALFLSVSGWHSWRSGLPWREALPLGYEYSLLGVLLFALGGVADMIWHELFGIEENIEALFSPSHMVLAIGAWLTMSGPFRALWRRTPQSLNTWRQQLPLWLSLTLMLSLLTFFTEMAHPIPHPQFLGVSLTSRQEAVKAMAMTSLLLNMTVLMSLVLLAVRRWQLLPGSLTFILTLNALAMSFLYDGPLNMQAIALGAAIPAGLLSDGLYYWLRPGLDHPTALRYFAFLMPVVVYGSLYLALYQVSRIWWSIHMWGGSLVLSGLLGLLLSYLLLPPVIPQNEYHNQN